MTKNPREGLPFAKETPWEVIQKIGQDGYSGGVDDVCLFPTYKCDLNCYMCHVQHNRGKDEQTMPAEELKKVFENLTPSTMFHLGGEPFVRSDMMEVLGLKTLKNLVCVQVSLNGLSESDNKIRGSSNAYERTVEGIKILKDAGLQVWIHSVILNENIHDLGNVVRLGGELGVGMVNFLFGQMMSEQDAQETREKVNRWLGEEVVIGGYVGEINYTEEQLINSVNEAKEVGQKLGLQVCFFPQIFGEHPEMYYHGTLLEQERPICQMTLMPPLTPIVGPEGNVYGCCIIDKSFGNVKENSLEEIWDSEALRNLRKGMITEKLMPICKRCPSGDLVKMAAPGASEVMDKAEWENYLKELTNAMNELPEIAPLLKEIAPIIFQYQLNDHPEYNYWHAFDADGIRWGLGENTEETPHKLFHKTDFATLRKVNAGEDNPIQATMAGTYAVDGDVSKLMSCAPLIPLTAKAHGIAVSKIKE
jgi:MoaA/NifB/PqqE/SkfB family radical SAM enzyme